VRVEVIADGHHVAPEVIRMILAAKGADRVILVTDAMAGAGAGEGIYDLGGNRVTVRNGRATLDDGTLAGSVLTMDRAAANVRAWAGSTGTPLPASPPRTPPTRWAGRIRPPRPRRRRRLRARG
jgi:N-acetylglucosamine-6-phosphate deacetylase